MKTPPPFPLAVCWDETTRQAVTDTTALNVRYSVFLATHAPSPIRRLNLTMSPPVATSYSEEEFRADFFQSDVQHLFSVVTGNTGTGKSHLIRWLAREAQRAGRPDWHIVPIPRHAANLADVIRRVLDERFSSEMVNKIREQLQRTSDLTPEGARTRVLDELAFVLEPQNRKNARLEFPRDEEHQEIILPNLPALLRDPAFRRHLQSQGVTGIVGRLAQHIMGRRADRPGDVVLEWAESDLRMPAQEIHRLGADARELASHIAQDSSTRARTAAALNTALAQAGPALLGLRRGQLGAALLDIRRQLLAEQKELVLLIEDLSVSQGMDAELVEALLVKPNEEGGAICPLRSVVGVTAEDFESMRSNLLGRINLAVDFQVPLTSDGEPTGGFSEQDLLSFASRYLNAARFSLADLDAWAAKNPEEPLPSFCHQSRCPNRAECHGAFGAVQDRGLYPLNETAVIRLYRKVVRVEGIPFNPRKFVDGVLRAILEKGAVDIPANAFPSHFLRQWYELDGVGVEGQLALASHYGPNAERARTAVEIYSDEPQTARLEATVAATFGLKGFAGRKTAGRGSAAPTTAPTVATPTTPTPPIQDEFDRWVNGEPPAEKSINHWRTLVASAINGAHDWDCDPLRGAYGVFEASWISFGGQRTVPRGDIRLEIPQRAEAAFALKTLKSGATSIDALVRTGEQIFEWVDTLRKELLRYDRTDGAKPLEVAVHLLAIGALLRGKKLIKGDPADVMRALFEKPDDRSAAPPTSPRSQAWSRVEGVFSRNLSEIQKWVRDRAGAPKGLSADTDFVDAIALLAFVKSAAARVRWDFADISADEWPARHLTPLRETLVTVQQFLPKALEEIRGEAKRHVAELDAACGEASVSQLCEALRTALDRGREATVFNDSRLDEARPSLDDLASGRFVETIKVARHLQEDEALNAQLGHCATLDLVGLRRLSAALAVSKQVLTAAKTTLRTRVEQLGAGDVPALEESVRDGIQALRTDLEKLIQD